MRCCDPTNVESSRPQGKQAWNSVPQDFLWRCLSARKNQLKLAICGTHSTGKTSLLRNVESVLRERGYTVGRVAELAVEARKRGFPILRDHTFGSTLWIMARGITLELEAGLAADVVLVDRPVPGAMDYLLAALKHRGSHLEIHRTNYLRCLVKEHAGTYQRIFKTVIDDAKAIDSTKPRDMDPEFRLQVAVELDHLFDDLRIPFEALNTEPDAARDQILQSTMSLLGSNSA
jgi:hypothetical protein